MLERNPRYGKRMNHFPCLRKLIYHQFNRRMAIKLKIGVNYDIRQEQRDKDEKLSSSHRRAFRQVHMELYFSLMFLLLKLFNEISTFFF